MVGLAEGTKGNPRQIKRFLNSLFLRLQVARSRGLEQIETTTLAKLMLAERFSENLYTVIEREASVHPDGESMLLRNLEQSNSDSAEDEEVQKWGSNPWVTRWLKIEPPLAAIDLRPYLFISRDRKTFFDGRSIPDHISDIASALTGSSMSIRNAEEAVRKLVIKESESIFGLLTAGIRKIEDYESPPNGFDGLLFLVQCHPHLERSLLEFLRELPPHKLGTWAAVGYGSLFKAEEMQAEFSRLKEEWREKGSKGLKAGLRVSDASEQGKKR